MEKQWQLQHAKNKLSEVVNDAIQTGPQVITRHGEQVAVVISYADYARMRAPQGNLAEFFRAAPLVGVELDLERDQSLPRAVELT
jgi:prevent-host-death family protein